MYYYNKREIQKHMTSKKWPLTCIIKRRRNIFCCQYILHIHCIYYYIFVYQMLFYDKFQRFWKNSVALVTIRALWAFNKYNQINLILPEMLKIGVKKRLIYIYKQYYRMELEVLCYYCNYISQDVNCVLKMRIWYNLLIIWSKLFLNSQRVPELYDYISKE